MPRSNILEFPQYSTLIVPGYQGSGPGHWQTWLERELSDARRVSGIDWSTPSLERWSDAIQVAVRYATGPVWLVAHSFGCLAAVTAASRTPSRIAGALLVAPGDPDRFSPDGLREETGGASVAAQLPQDLLAFPSLVVASANDPWMKPARVAYWADRWGSAVAQVGKAGHINEASGFGPWPEGLALLRAFKAAQGKGLAAPTQLASGSDSDHLQRADVGVIHRRLAVGE
ncbi:alpha/beta hydrolase [Thiorhodococcus mannitoliphagus]|uniref:Alpha/beta hydrolase n=1 Tax=Thiorhodococcus mannitoliphagus TaxID=329406 RepID=A0A6P1DZQ8_9GAMM|nr:alpha/beta hydrolase [Thiorhodococcus mannitoliphagus]NEX23698.1 alpha/beta hydrolase [Thiorhodococcus mannitoliphagus]